MCRSRRANRNHLGCRNHRRRQSRRGSSLEHLTCQGCPSTPAPTTRKDHQHLTRGGERRGTHGSRNYPPTHRARHPVRGRCPGPSGRWGTPAARRGSRHPTASPAGHPGARPGRNCPARPASRPALGRCPGPVNRGPRNRTGPSTTRARPPPCLTRKTRSSPERHHDERPRTHGRRRNHKCPASLVQRHPKPLVGKTPQRAPTGRDRLRNRRAARAVRAPRRRRALREARGR